MKAEDDEPKDIPASTKPVGYRNPPEASRFKKGNSGNP